MNIFYIDETAEYNGEEPRSRRPTLNPDTYFHFPLKRSGAFSFFKGEGMADIEVCPKCGYHPIRCYGRDGKIRKMVCMDQACQHQFELDTPAPEQKIDIQRGILSRQVMGKF